MGTQYIVWLRTLNIKSNTLRMKAFVAAVATLAASANSQVLVNPYHGGLVHPGFAYAGVPVTTVEAPATIAAAPAAIAPLPVAPLTQQFHSQDEFGNTGYGYTNINSAKHEVGHPLVGVSGGYSFVDANNELQTVSYVADGRGFQVKATNLPVAPTFNPELPVAPVDTAEVAAAKADHAAAHAEINAREKRSTPASTEVLEIKPLEVKALPLTYGTYGPFAGAVAPFAGAYAGGYAPLSGAFTPHYLGAPVAPLGYKAPLLAQAAAPLKAVVAAVPGAAEATLTKIKLTPGHAIAYKVE